jgi:hypothetical protein
MLQTAFGEQCLSCAHIFKWHKGFKEGQDSVDDNLRSGRPMTSKTDNCVAQVQELIRANRRSTIHEPSAKDGVSYGTCQVILTQDLNMRRVAAKFVPQILTAEQKEWHLSVATNMMQEAESEENFIGQIIMGDETWVYGYDPETKRRLRSVSLLIPRGQRKCARCSQKSKSCSLSSLIWRALFIMSTFHKAKL